MLDITQLKANLDESSRLRLAVMTEDGRQLGWLECIDRGLAARSEVAKQLTKWRRMFMRYFLTQFEATELRTRDWLLNVVLPAPDRILFRILTDDETPIGNFGVCGLADATAELDNLIRGEHGGDPQLIAYAEIALLNWLFEDLGVEDVSLHVFSNNTKTIALHSSVGFVEETRLALTKEVRDGFAHYNVQGAHGTLVDFSYVRMRLTREEFRRRYRWRSRIEREHMEHMTEESADRRFEEDRDVYSRRALMDSRVKAATREFVIATAPYRYAYNFRWLGRPVIQFPQDMIAMQELIWRVRPELIIETGIAHGGSLIYYASLLELIGHGTVLGIDIDIRPHNRAAIEVHPMAKRVTMLQGSAIDPDVVAQVRGLAAGKAPIMVVLDSNHTHEHVLAELEAYADLVSAGSYCVVFDTVVEDLPADLYPDRPWGPGNNPKTAVREFLQRDTRFEIDRDIEAKILVTVAPDGYLKRVR